MAGWGNRAKGGGAGGQPSKARDLSAGAPRLNDEYKIVRPCPIGVRQGTMVRINQDISEGGRGTIGRVHELRGWDFEGGKKYNRFLNIWAERQILPDGRYSAGGFIGCSSRVLDIVAKRK